MKRRHFLAASVGLASLACADVPCAADEIDPRPTIMRGVDWLLKQQDQDGGWHSATYGALRQGSATTAFAIYALSHLHHSFVDKKIKDATARGFEFLSPGIKKRGFVAAPDGSLDYPTYGTAMLAAAAYQHDFGMSEELRESFVDWVASGQLTETREFTEKSPHYGGWDLMGASQVKGLTSDTNVSCSSFAIEAIHHGITAKGKERHRERVAVLDRARRWTERCQDLQGDGGFWFSPDTTSINHKAGWHDEQQTKPKTYASATADGLRCLRTSFFVGKDDKHIAAAEKYLEAHSEIKTVPGFAEPEDPNGWAMGLRFYYYQSLAKAMVPRQQWALQRRAVLLQHIAKLQAKDGRWQNESARMREDDPLIATCLAIVALTTLEQWDRAEPPRDKQP